MKLLTPTKSTFDRYHSHSNKFLRVHIEGVLQGTALRSAPYSCAEIAQWAALFHDFGKLNPNFQPKVNPAFAPQKPLQSDYSSHAYLSAYAFLCYCAMNPDRLKGALSYQKIFQIVAIVAHHHGDLPNFENILHGEECKKVLSFLKENPPLPISEYLAQWMPHQAFDILDEKQHHFLLPNERNIFRGITLPALRKLAPQRLDYFLETQFAFASVIEADKRDAADNKFYRRQEQIEWAKAHFENDLQKYFLQLQDSPKAQIPLNQTRTRIREDSETALRQELERGARTFCLTAPTGAGKTLTLLALASVIRERSPEHSVVYGLPFLTITEQVEAQCHKIFGEDFVSRHDSRTVNKKLDKLLGELDESPEEWDAESTRLLLQEVFSSETFDAAFTVTTFVQIFETLLSNRNSALLKLPNFAKTIFILDEIQALPPRLYIFFAAYLQAFCKKFDSYAIFSTATMPAFEIPDAAQYARDLFTTYQPPKELLSHSYFENVVFDRYEVRPLASKAISREELAQEIIEKESSALIVLNTIEDSCQLYDLLCGEADAEVILLNTHFTLRDRQDKIVRCKDLLGQNKRVILVSTQLIEAGVDIDFPMVFRDLCPLPSLIQTAGRGNREGENPRATVWFFELQANNKSRAKLIYHEEPSWFLDFSREEILQSEGFCEKELLPIQQKYFLKVCQDLILGQHRLKVDGKYDTANVVEQIDNLAFENVGSFRLIDEEKYGETLRYFVPQPEDELDDRLEQLHDVIKEAIEAQRSVAPQDRYETAQKYTLKIQAQLQKIAPDTVQFRVPFRAKPPAFAMECCGICHLSIPKDYSFERGISFDGNASVFL